MIYGQIRKSLSVSSKVLNDDPPGGEMGAPSLNAPLFPVLALQSFLFNVNESAGMQGERPCSFSVANCCPSIYELPWYQCSFWFPNRQKTEKRGKSQSFQTLIVIVP